MPSSKPLHVTDESHALDIPPVRRRLHAGIRVQQILDAALEVFATYGFTATRIDDIARAAGLSKGGIYTHFKSKDEIFEALLNSALAEGAWTVALANQGAVSFKRLVKDIIDPLYAVVENPMAFNTLRLLMAEGPRMPQVVKLWRERVVLPHLAAIEAFLQRGVTEGVFRDGSLIRNGWIVLSPGVNYAIRRMVFGEEHLQPMAAAKSAHISMLKEMLV